LKNNSAVLFNKDWKFLLGDVKNAQNAGFNDRTWKNVDLPHDWVISQPFNRGEVGGWTPQNMQGFFAWQGVCWYRKEFMLPDIEDKTIYVCFGGAYRNSKVYINGKEAGGRANGYLSFEVDITSFAKEGKNLLAVRLDNGCEEPDRWYSGSGLYRDVYLKTVPKTHIKTWGVYVKPLLADNHKQADVLISTAIINGNRENSNTGQKKAGNQTDVSHGSLLNIKIIGPCNNCVAEDTIPFGFGGKNELTVEQKLQIKNPLLWSAQEPNLYRVVICIKTDGKTGESAEVNFGMRNIEIAHNIGMTVNGKNIKLKGVCLHHDAGIAGSAYYDAVWRRRLLTLKNIGCNAIRTSHNPVSEEFLDLCDELGFYVMDECFDKWKSGYYAAHYDADAKQDLTDFILRDRNHPCIFMWSIGNEVENQGADSMIAIQKRLAEIVRCLDNRPITCALAPHANPRSLVGAPAAELVKLTKKLTKDVDVIGLNYHEPLYQAYTEEIEKPIIGTECYEYYSSVETNFEDISCKNPWQFVLENDNVIGQFIWAGMDYLGESSWPAKGWAGSILDICGFMKPNAYFRKSIWTEEPFVYLAIYDQNKKNDYARGRWSFPAMASHLNFEHLERRTVTAAVFTNCEEAELYINGKKMGRRKKAGFNNGIIEWTFEYTCGNVEVKGINKGEQICSHIIKTAGQAHKIKLVPDRQNLKAGCADIAHIEISIIDKEGLLCPNEEMLVEFALTGDGQFLGACSPDLNQNLGFTLPKVVTSQGRALAMIKAGDNSGTIEVFAYSEKLENASLRFKVK
jgi:beta-galactosidase